MMSKAAEELLAQLKVKSSDRIALDTVPAAKKEAAQSERTIPGVTVSAACWE
jgi:hypothetical protein